MAFLDPVFNPVLMPIVNLSPFWALVILALFISIIVTLVYKWTTNQAHMKELKDKQKEYQKQMKELRSNPQEMMKVQKEAMKINFEYMKHSLKPTLITMIPVLLIFGWMVGHFSFEPIYPNEAFSITAQFKEGSVGEAVLIVDNSTEILSPSAQNISNDQATWSLKSNSEGERSLIVKALGEEQTKKVLITTELTTSEQFTLYKHSAIEQINVNYNKLHPLGKFSIFGWLPGWLGLYIIFSLIFSIALRKLFKLY